MVQEAVGSVDEVPQRGTLLRRAHELLESIGQPTAEDLLIQHLFGVSEGSTGRPAVWSMLLRQTLQSSSLFEQADEHHEQRPVDLAVNLFRLDPAGEQQQRASNDRDLGDRLVGKE